MDWGDVGYDLWCVRHGGLGKGKGGQGGHGGTDRKSHGISFEITCFVVSAGL